MGKQQFGPKNPFWRGGRSIASNGYVLIRVGKDHHLADVRGYAYEHRLVAEKMLGRRLEPGEHVHHRDHDKQHNAESNLEVLPAGWHRVEHRKRQKGLRLPGQPNPVVSCACGCGMRFDKFDSTRRPRRFVTGHNIHPRRAA